MGSLWPAPLTPRTSSLQADVFRDNIPYTPLTPKTSSLQAEVSRDSITYAALSLDTSDEQPTYSNMEHTDTTIWISDVLLCLPSYQEEIVARLGERLVPYSRTSVALSFKLHFPTQVPPLPPNYLCRCLHNCLLISPELTISKLPLLSD